MKEILDYTELEKDLGGYLYAILNTENKLYRTYSLYEAVRKYNNEGKRFYIYQHDSVKKNQYILRFWK